MLRLLAPEPARDLVEHGPAAITTLAPTDLGPDLAGGTHVVLDAPARSSGRRLIDVN